MNQETQGTLYAPARWALFDLEGAVSQPQSAAHTAEASCAAGCQRESMRALMTGSGNSMRSSTMGFLSSHNVSPVVTSLRPAMATMSPVRACVMSCGNGKSERVTKQQEPWIWMRHPLSLP